MGPEGSADLHFYSPQPDTSLHCEATNTGSVYRAACLFTPQIILLGDRGTQVQVRKGKKNAGILCAIQKLMKSA